MLDFPCKQASRKQIGGFLELELPTKASNYHSGAIALTTGRSCLHLILKRCRPSKIYFPFYTCNATYEPAKLCGVTQEYYGINEQLEPITFPKLNANEFFLYVNYFGIKNTAVDELIQLYGCQLIIDNTQAFFQTKYPTPWSFNSARKFFGVPDGAYLYSKFNLNPQLEPNLRVQYQHLIERLIGNLDSAYPIFQDNERILDSSIMSPSPLSLRLLENIDYKAVKERRNQTFKFVHNYVGQYNNIDIDVGSIDGPMCYPLITSKPIDKKQLYEYGFFIPVYWKEILEKHVSGFEIEKYIASHLTAIPVDQRYYSADLLPLLNCLLSEI